MTLFEFMKHSKGGFDSLANEAGTSPAYLEQIARGYRNASIKLGKKLVAASGGQLTLEEIIPALRSDAS